MKGIPIVELDGKLGELLTDMNGSVTYNYETPIRCDQCSKVIHPNQPCSIWFADRYLTEPETQQQFRLTRIECEDCTPHTLFALRATEGEYTKDQLRALKQSMGGDVTEKEIQQYSKYLESEFESILRDAFL